MGRALRSGRGKLGILNDTTANTSYYAVERRIITRVTPGAFVSLVANAHIEVARAWQALSVFRGLLNMIDRNRIDRRSRRFEL